MRFIRAADDVRLERLPGSALGLRAIFFGMARRYSPERAGGFAGDIEYRLRRRNGAHRIWHVRCEPHGARSRRGPSPDPALTLSLSVADFVRLLLRELDPGTALVTGRLRLDGDLLVALRLGRMFGP